MTEPPGDGAYINASADELGGSEVPEIVKANGRSTHLVSNPYEEGRDVVRPKWFRALDVG